jgi:hypothetical protein
VFGGRQGLLDRDERRIELSMPDQSPRQNAEELGVANMPAGLIACIEHSSQRDFVCKVMPIRPEAEAADPGFTLCWVLHHAVCPIALLTGEIAIADWGVAAMSDVATRLDAGLWRILAGYREGKALVERREFARGPGSSRAAAIDPLGIHPGSRGTW